MVGAGDAELVDPALPEVQQYLIDIALEVVGFGVDEIQLDYVRFPTEGRIEEAVFSFDPEVLSKSAVITDFVRRMRAAQSQRGRVCRQIYSVLRRGEVGQILRQSAKT